MINKKYVVALSLGLVLISQISKADGEDKYKAFRSELTELDSFNDLKKHGFEFSAHGQCRGQEFKISVQSFGPFAVLIIDGEQYFLDEESLKLPSFDQEISKGKVHIAKRNTSLFMFGSDYGAYVTPGTGAVLFRELDTETLKPSSTKGCLLTSVAKEGIAEAQNKDSITVGQDNRTVPNAALAE